jgi:hypothetical protein
LGHDHHGGHAREDLAMTPRERIRLFVWSLAAWTFLFFAALALLTGSAWAGPAQVRDGASSKGAVFGPPLLLSS